MRGCSKGQSTDTRPHQQNAHQAHLSRQLKAATACQLTDALLQRGGQETAGPFELHIINFEPDMSLLDRFFSRLLPLDPKPPI